MTEVPTNVFSPEHYDYQNGDLRWTGDLQVESLLLFASKLGYEPIGERYLTSAGFEYINYPKPRPALHFVSFHTMKYWHDNAEVLEHSVFDLKHMAQYRKVAQLKLQRSRNGLIVQDSLIKEL